MLNVSRLNEQGRAGRCVRKEFNSMYRWHLADPIAWQREERITIQQIAWKDGLVETRDDWSTAIFWYEPLPAHRYPSCRT